MTLILRLPPAELADLERQVRAAGPRECCGALLGAIRGGTTVAARWIPLTNTDSRPNRFSTPDTELRRARRIAAAATMELVAILHSHPTSPARLSPYDREALRYSQVPWVIVALAPGGGLEIAAFAAGDGMDLQVVSFAGLEPSFGAADHSRASSRGPVPERPAPAPAADVDASPARR